MWRFGVLSIAALRPGLAGLKGAFTGLYGAWVCKVLILLRFYFAVLESFEALNSIFVDFYVICEWYC